MTYHFELYYKKDGEDRPLFKADHKMTLEKYVEQLNAAGIFEKYQINKVITSHEKESTCETLKLDEKKTCAV